MTDNISVDAAASWVLDNQHLPDINDPFKVQYYMKGLISSWKPLELLKFAIYA